MKKTASFLLTLAASMTMGINSFATEPIETTVDNQPVEVKATYTDATPVIYSFDLSWTAMNFTYVGGSKGTWNPETCKYENPVEGEWTEDSKGKITITNHSNVNLKYWIWYGRNTEYMDVYVSFQKQGYDDWWDNVNQATVSSVAYNREVEWKDPDRDPYIGTTVVYMVEPRGELPENASASKMGAISIRVKGE